MRRARLLLLLGLAAAGLWGCGGLFREPTVPMATVAWTEGAPAGRPLMIFLPGRGGAAEDFETRGFTAAAREADPSWGLLAVDAHFGYYRERTLIERVWQDVIEPARQAGHTEIWLVGTSMGGLGAIQVARHDPDAIAGLILLAPYLGPKETIQEIEAAGGLAAWTPPHQGSWPDELWAWLKGYEGDNGRPRLILAYGDRDRLGPANGLLGAVLPADRVLVGSGGHGWKVWTPLWKQILERWFHDAPEAGLAAGNR